MPLAMILLLSALAPFRRRAARHQFRHAFISAFFASVAAYAIDISRQDYVTRKHYYYFTFTPPTR
jgi:hypothetical protein